MLPSARLFAPNRREFLNRFGMGLGGIALADMLQPAASGAAALDHGVLGEPHFAPKARRVIYLFMSGGPSQLDLFDYKPKLRDKFNADLPDEIRHGQRITTMTSGQARFPIAPSV